MAEEPGNAVFGVYTRTVVRSPVILWILHAQIRSRWCNDVVFVGEDFIQVKEVGKDGHLQLMASKDDFDGHIRAASVFSNEDDGKDEDFLVKLEKERTGFEPDDLPLQTLVLTLDSNDLVFLYLRTGSDGTPRFAQQMVPMPCWDRILFQPGEYLAVDPHSRALAVAANEREVILYSPKPKDQIQTEMKLGSDAWCPVASQRPLPVDGVIQQMDFLMPPANDDDHIILLLIVTDQRRTKAVRIEWYYSSGPQEAQIHPGQALESDKRVPSLLVPLPDSSFLLAVGNEVTRWKDILSGSASGIEVDITPEKAPRFAGVSAHAPVWTGWTRPRRNKAAKRITDNIYIAREDGYVFWMTMSASGSLSSVLAADLKCHVGPAFASLGREDGPDILAVAGETSSGVVISIGQWPSIRRLEELSRSDTMDPETIELLPNWTSATDMISMLPTHANHDQPIHTENLMVTSGRQPFGSIAELRQGLELSLSINMELPGLRHVTDIWTLPNSSDGSILAVLSMPLSTRIISIPAAFDDGLEEVDDTSPFDLTRRTLAASITASGELVQVTERGFCVSSSLLANFEDTWKENMDNDASIVAAAIVTEMSLLIIAVSQEGVHRVRACGLPSADSTSGISQVFNVEVEARPLALHAVAVGDSLIVAMATDKSKVILLTWDDSMSAPSTHTQSLTSPHDEVLGDSLAILQAKDDRDKTSGLLVACGLRDGRLVNFTIDERPERMLGDRHEVSLGVSSIKLVPVSNDKASAIAMSGESTYMLGWRGPNSCNLAIENIWTTDKQQPEFAPGPIAACSQIPPAAYLSSPAAADSTVMIASDNFLLGRIGSHPTTVPRQIPVSGTPNRLIYADTLKSYVCASLFAEVRTLPSSKPHSPAEEKRQIWPVLDFIPRKGSQPSFSHHMQPGERIHSLLQWSYRRGTEKSYSFVLIGGSYVRHSGARRGRVTFLQCPLKNGEVIEAKEIQKEVFDHEVYALALYDETTYVVCAGEQVHLRRFSADTTRWSEPCMPYKLASAGICATAETDHSGRKVIVISTLRDSLVSLRLDEAPAENGSEITRSTLVPVAMGPRAENLLSHLVLPTDSAPYTQDKIDQYALMTTKYGQIIGIEIPKTPEAGPTHHRVGNLVFEVQLPRSLTRLLRSPPAARKGSPPEGVIPERIRGSSTDGSLVSIALLGRDIRRRLCWLQRLIEWSAELSPYSYRTPSYSLTDRRLGTNRRSVGLPLGLHEDDNFYIMFAIFYTANQNPLNDVHLDGDVLARCLRKGGAEAVREVLRLVATEDSWVAEHLEEELAAVDENVEVVRRLDAWM